MNYLNMGMTGAVPGALLPKDSFSWLKELFMGKDPQMQQLSTQTPGQTDMLGQLMQMLQGGQSNLTGGNYLQSLFGNDPNAFQDYEAPLMRQFNEQVVPGLSERFSGAGMGSRNSSAFNNQLASAGTRLTEMLGAQRGQMRQNGLGSLTNLFGQSQQPQFENLAMQGQPGLLQYLAQGAGQAATKYMSGGF